MAVPAGLVRLSDAAHKRNLKGDISNGKYGVDWLQQTQAGGDVGEGAWNEQNVSYASQAIASRLEAAGNTNAPAPVASPVAGPTPASAPQPAPMQALGAAAQGFEELNSPSALNPSLGNRLNPATLKSLASMAGRIY